MNTPQHPLNKIFILDASGYLFRSYYAIRHMTNGKGESTNALFGFIRSVMKLVKDFQPEHIVSVFDGPNNSKSREEIYPEYKAHRTAMPQDLLYQIKWAIDFCHVMGIPILNVHNVEADDTMGSVAKWAESEGATVYLCTSDKDMSQFVNEKILLLNTYKENLILGSKEVEEMYGVPPDKILDFLAITGDSSDNIPGLPGFGPKTAATLLKEMGSLEAILANPSAVPGKKKQDTIIENAHLARISKQLATIDINVPFPKDPDFFYLKPHDHPNLKEFYSYMNFHTLLKELEEGREKASPDAPSDSDVSYTLVDDETALQNLITTLSAQNEICVSTKTTHTQPQKSQLVGIGLGFQKKQAWYIPVNGTLGKDRALAALRPLFENAQIGFYGHNVKFDYEILLSHNIKIAKICFDTILASFLLNSHSRQHSLDYLSLESFGKVKTPIQSLIGKGKSEISMLDVSIEKVCAYCCEDVDYICRLKQILEKQLKERNLTHLLDDIELPLLTILADMEIKGIYIDVPYLHGMSKKIHIHIKQLEDEIYAMAGESFNINSPKQLSHILFTKLGIKPPKKTATGLSTNADVLEFLQDEHPLAGKLLEYRSLEKLRSTYIDALPNEVNPQTSRIHCTFNQYSVATGRLSSQDPNLQNIPVRTEFGRQIRTAFCPQKEGWSYLSADYSQIELRLVAHLSEDPDILQAFAAGEDIHAHTAAAVLNIPLNEVTKEQRYQAKAVNFGIMYGQQAYGLSQELKIDVKEAAAFIEAYFQRFKRVKEFIEENKAKARTAGKAVTITGRERPIPEINSKNGMLRAAAERLAINTPLQGTAADLIKLAMIKVDQELKAHYMQSFLVLQIHDELLFEVPNDELSKMENLVRTAMQDVWKLKVPLTVDIAIGKNWEKC